MKMKIFVLRQELILLFFIFILQLLTNFILAVINFVRKVFKLLCLNWLIITRMDVFETGNWLYIVFLAIVAVVKQTFSLDKDRIIETYRNLSLTRNTAICVVFNMKREQKRKRALCKK
ncbi:hypothetical protein KUTeg_022658 [Tegillarca granosa]|uniref:Uncharacterized protein n=1 Tax=Tegillarca granosa TaxID=220873 RepID=A0ABQ9DZB2_TEGGR|nr:hypothetical protein KUTeg_022658 [Tegillarca granosa]